MAAPDGTRLGRASPLIKARVATKDPARTLGFVEQTTLFVVAIKKTDALALLDGFTESARQRARIFAQQLADLDSSTRQARLALAFGARDDAPTRLKALLAEAPAGLKAAVLAQLPPALRPSTAGLAAPAATASPALVALASRLIREATR
ncbi:MAG: hypothetical protein MUC96_27820 [Myxococcaceae bacterium]|jgi:hypothetical protein|nr:hypothetical protein [Myxococcaceae bacterium]